MKYIIDAQRLVDDIHGSGFYYIPEITRNRSNITMNWAYQCMNDAGYYDGFVDFRITIPLKAPDLFKMFIPRESRRKADEYDVTDYIEETFYAAICEQLNAQ